MMPVLSAPPKTTHDKGGARLTSLSTPARGSFDTSVWRVEIAPGHPATPHQLTREEVFIVLAGRARVRLGEEIREAGVGDAIVVPRDTLFEIDVTGDEPLQALCCMPVGGEARLADGTTLVPPWSE
jgi:mannose-6-phosphate isomerase-like protein (cupin superfamily)